MSEGGSTDHQGSKTLKKSLRNPLTGAQTSDIIKMSEGEQERKQISLETQDLMILLTENKREKIFGNLLTDFKIRDIINTNKGKDTLQTRKELTL